MQKILPFLFLFTLQMIWEIGQDALGSNIEYSLLRAIDEIVDAGTV